MGKKQEIGNYQERSEIVRLEYEYELFLKLSKDNHKKDYAKSILK
jgi:hypothetical protein